MSEKLGIVLEQEKELMLSDFKRENPDMYEQYKDLVNFSSYEQPITVDICTWENRLNG